MTGKKVRVLTAILAAMIAASLAGCQGAPAAPAASSEAAQEQAQENKEPEEKAEESKEETEKEAGKDGEAGEAGEAGAEAEGAKDASSESSAEAEETAENPAEETEEEEEDEEVLTGERKRRILPHEEKKPETEAVKPDTTVYPAAAEEIKKPEKITGSSVMFVVKNKKAKDPEVKKKDDSYPDSQEDVDAILADLMVYWEKDEFDAVDYLLRMDKFRYLSQQLKGTNDYFYFGDEDPATGLPNGKGIAVYANDQYYYGSFKDGLRSGHGTWYRIFVRDGVYCKANNGIYGHSYRGEWANDLPNGDGQEHLDIDASYADGRIITNVIGGFVNGYYHGDMIATSVHPDSGKNDWTGTAIYGTWVPIDRIVNTGKSGKKEVPVLRNAENPDNYVWMIQSENMGQGITGLIP